MTTSDRLRVLKQRTRSIRSRLVQRSILNVERINAMRSTKGHQVNEIKLSVFSRNKPQACGELIELVHLLIMRVNKR
jgi:hypothetical protein